MTDNVSAGTRTPLLGRGWFVVFVAVAVAALMRLPGLGFPLWNVDEACIAAVGAISIDGGIPYQDWVDHRAPLTNLIYAVVFLVFGSYNMFAIHTALLVVIATMIVVTHRLGARIVGGLGAAAAVFILAAVSSAGYPASDLFAFNVEWGMALCTGLGMLLLVRGLVTPGGTAVFATAGIAFAMAMLFKQVAVFDLLAAVFFVLFVWWRRAPELAVATHRQAALRLAAMAAGGIATAAAVVSLIIGLGVWEDFFFYTVTYNTDYYAAPFSPRKYLGNAYLGWLQAARPVGIGWLATVGGIAMITGFLRRRGRDDSVSRRLHPLLLLWTFSSFVGVAASGRFYPHYFVQILIPWSLLAGFALQELASPIAALAKQRLPPAAVRASTAVAMAAATVWFVVLPWQNVSPARIELQSRWVIDDATTHLAMYLDQVTRPRDKVFMWGFYPIPYLLAKRLPASRFVYCTFVTGANLGGGGNAEERPVPWAMDDLLSDLKNNRPAVIIDTSPGGYFHWDRYPLERYPALMAFIESEYVPDEVYRRLHGDGHFTLYRRRTH
jgi:4-amino-4-deoxy-L-arabinose transferase-like glycosyltransferase